MFPLLVSVLIDGWIKRSLFFKKCPREGKTELNQSSDIHINKRGSVSHEEQSNNPSRNQQQCISVIIYEEKKKERNKNIVENLLPGKSWRPLFLWLSVTSFRIPSSLLSLFPMFLSCPVSHYQLSYSSLSKHGAFNRQHGRPSLFATRPMRLLSCIRRSPSPPYFQKWISSTPRVIFEISLGPNL